MYLKLHNKISLLILRNLVLSLKNVQVYIQVPEMIQNNTQGFRDNTQVFRYNTQVMHLSKKKNNDQHRIHQAEKREMTTSHHK